MKLEQIYMIILILFSQSGFCQNKEIFLSNLNASKDSPLYTTYAAQMERSEFILDEGFHFLFYDPERGIDFTSDTGGDMCIAFKCGPKYVYHVKDMYREPLIHASYSDIVTYSYFPFPDIKVDATFLVYSSRIAIHNLKIQNTGKGQIDLKLFAFLQNNYRTFNDIHLNKTEHKITFTHEELPDSWVLEHNIPYVDKVYNVFMLSEQPERMTCFRSYRWGNIALPLKIDLNINQKYIVWGMMSHAGGERCRHDNPKPKLLVILNDDSSKIITETASKWGRADKNINPYGFYSIELGNFSQIKSGDRYTMSLFCPETVEYASLRGTICNLDTMNATRYDVVFDQNEIVPIPGNLKKDVWGGGAEIRLYWDKHVEHVSYNVYRCDYRKNRVYELIADKINRTFFTDKNIQGDKIYGYVVTGIDANGKMSMPTNEVTNIFRSDFLTDIKYPDQIRTDVTDLARVVSMQKNMTIKPGESINLRIIRGFARNERNLEEITQQAKTLFSENLTQFIAYNEKLYASVPKYSFNDADKEMLYWSAWNLMRQVMLPAEGKCGYNYYVFSREPTWGWGHGGQVFHESLTMLAYAFMDPQSAMNSQRVYLERQHKNGYINYRTGPYLDEIIEVNGEFTSSAPWYAWQNWQVYKITQDKKFLEEMYQSSKQFFDYYVSNHDKDQDGLYEWGGHAVLESVRDARVAVWDQVGWPTNFEALDLNTMLANEAMTLAAMAEELGRAHDASIWTEKAKNLSNLINKTFWDEESGFYYHVDRDDHDFSFSSENNLKRQEIIGFLPLWAGIATEKQAKRLVTHLTNDKKFWRKYGIPSLAADDVYYNDKGYWNGPVWVEWNYLIVEGLIKYGYHEQAKELVDRIAVNMMAQLKKDHNFWEFYSPDSQWAGYHKTYIWAGIINRMLIDIANLSR